MGGGQSGGGEGVEVEMGEEGGEDDYPADETYAVTEEGGCEPGGEGGNVEGDLGWHFVFVEMRDGEMEGDFVKGYEGSLA
jgi:hypothetical protein